MSQLSLLAESSNYVAPLRSALVLWRRILTRFGISTERTSAASELAQPWRALARCLLSVRCTVRAFEQLAGLALLLGQRALYVESSSTLANLLWLLVNCACASPEGRAFDGLTGDQERALERYVRLEAVLAIQLLDSSCAALPVAKEELRGAGSRLALVSRARTGLETCRARLRIIENLYLQRASTPRSGDSPSPWQPNPKYLNWLLLAEYYLLALTSQVCITRFLQVHKLIFY